MARQNVRGIVGRILVAAILTWAASAAAADDPEPRIGDLRISSEGQQLLVSFAILQLIDEKTELRIQSGLPTDVVFVIQLIRPRKGWFDKTVETVRFTASVVYNAVTREFTINHKIDDQLIQSLIYQDVRDMRKAMTELERVPVFSLEGHAGERLRVRVRAELGTRTILFFIPTTKTTDWQESERFEVGPDGQLESVDGKDE